MAEEYDVVVLGSGEAGKYLAWALASQGKKVAVIERRYVGGSCPNFACLPSKNVIHSAKVASYFRRSEELGLAKDGWRIDMAGVRDRKRRPDGGRVGRDAPLQVPVERGGARPGRRLLRRPEDGRGHPPRGRDAGLARGECRHLHRVARPLRHVEALELDRVPG